jgi:hypothetical protein
MPSISWKEFDRSDAANTLGARVTITRQGYISLNQTAYNLLGGPPAVVLLYDPGGAAIGLRAASESTAYSLRVRPRGQGTHYVINTAAFMRRYGIDYSRLIAFKRVALEDGILILPFDQAYRKGQGLPRSADAAGPRLDAPCGQRDIPLGRVETPAQSC